MHLVVVIMGQSRDQHQSQFDHVQEPVRVIEGGRTQVLHSPTTVALAVAGGLARSSMIGTLSSHTTECATSQATSRPIVRLVVW